MQAGKKRVGKGDAVAAVQLDHVGASLARMSLDVRKSRESGLADDPEGVRSAAPGREIDGIAAVAVVEDDRIVSQAEIERIASGAGIECVVAEVAP